MGLNHPSDLEAFRRDAENRQSFARLRRFRRRIRPDADRLVLYLTRLDDGPEVETKSTPDILLACDSRAPSSRLAVLGVIDHLDPTRLAVLTPFPLEARDLPGDASDRRVRLGRSEPITTLDELRSALPEIAVVLSAGHHLPVGAMADQLVRCSAASSIVIQHGMLLPQAPPLPHDVTVAVWSSEDGAFWAGERPDVDVVVVGSELIRQATLTAATPVRVDATPLFCGALHGTEMPRLQIESISRNFCRATGARYRPHPSEVDLQSRLTHLVWRALGITFDTGDRPLIESDAPVVGICSTGILEAAAAGLPAWVYHPDPPAWLVEVWERNGLAQWGSPPTPRPDIGEGEPARVLAELVLAAS